MSIDKKEKKEKKMETTVLIFDRKGKKYKVYKQTNHTNGWYRRLLATFKTSQEAERFMNSRP